MYGIKVSPFIGTDIGQVFSKEKNQKTILLGGAAGLDIQYKNLSTKFTYTKPLKHSDNK